MKQKLRSGLFTYNDKKNLNLGGLYYKIINKHLKIIKMTKAYTKHPKLQQKLRKNLPNFGVKDFPFSQREGSQRIVEKSEKKDHINRYCGVKDFFYITFTVDV